MEDIEIAKEILKEEDLRLVLVNGGQVIYKTKDRGIKPMFDLVENFMEEALGGSIADRVIGKGASILASHLKIESVYTEIISQAALEVLEGRGVKTEYDLLTPYIKNRDKSDYCPIEKLSQNIEDADELMIEIREFLKHQKERSHESSK